MAAKRSNSEEGVSFSQSLEPERHRLFVEVNILADASGGGSLTVPTDGAMDQKTQTGDQKNRLARDGMR